ncbi:MAG: DUF1367 family protein [Bellilinea sp.]
MTITKQLPLALTDAEKDVLRDLLFKTVDGLGEDDKKSWRRFWNRVIKAEVGELFSLDTWFPRNPRFHKKFFALLNFGFESWEPERKHKTHKGREVAKSFDQFREDIIVLAGHYDQTFDIKGRMVLKAKSIKFAKMDDAEFDRLYSSVVDVLLAQVFTKYKDKDELDAIIEKLMGFV